IMSVCSLFCIILNIMLSYIWSLSYGIKGVIVATAVSYFVASIVSSFFVFVVFRNMKSPESTYVQ
ncbi:MAG: hypothetical protein KAJ40_05555, partial [Alphaproteobacteria bacterium]|nr:hypothetical protein [Alphaproteobacteria bacterium]